MKPSGSFNDGIAQWWYRAFSTKSMQMVIALLFVCAFCACPSLAYAQELNGDLETNDVQLETSPGVAIGDDLAENDVGAKQGETKFENVDDDIPGREASGSICGDSGEENAGQPESPTSLSAEEVNEEAEIESSTPSSATEEPPVEVASATDGEEEPAAAAQAAPAAKPAAAAKEPAAKAAAKEPAAKADASSHPATVYYRVHVQNVGTQSWRKDGQTAGTSGRSLRLESIEFEVDGDLSGAIYCQVHVQDVGWQRLQSASVGKSAKSGTEGRSLRLEAVKFTLSGELSRWYDVSYRVHVQNDGWQGWKTNGQMAGTSGRSLRLEALELKLVRKESAPAAKASDGGPGLVYRAHVQNDGWQAQVASGQTAGTSGRSLRVEALRIW